MVGRTLLAVAAIIGLFVFSWTLYDVWTKPGDDLRNRVVGARVMLAGQDPYAFRWRPGMPEELLDPVHDPKAHRLTISPPTLLLYAPIAPLPWRTVRFISFACEWLAMLTSLALLARSLPTPGLRVVFLLGATLFVLATDIWRLHVERGQVYVFPLLALSVAVFYSERGRVDSLATGVALGFLGLMRPNLLVIAPALLLARQWRAGGAMCATVALGAGAAFAVLPASSWRSYLNVGDQYYRAIQDPAAVVDSPPPEHQGPVEDTVFGRDSLTNIESSSFAVFYQTCCEYLPLPKLDLALTSKIALAAIALVLLGFAWQRRCVALMIVLALDTEFFLPHRWGYADVMLLAPLAMMLPELLRPERVNRAALAIVLLGLVSGPFGQQFFGLYVATLLRSWLVMGGLTLLAISETKEPRAT